MVQTTVVEFIFQFRPWDFVLSVIIQSTGCWKTLITRRDQNGTPVQLCISHVPTCVQSLRIRIPKLGEGATVGNHWNQIAFYGTISILPHASNGTSKGTYDSTRGTNCTRHPSSFANLSSVFRGPCWSLSHSEPSMWWNEHSANSVDNIRPAFHGYCITVDTIRAMLLELPSEGLSGKWPYDTALAYRGIIAVNGVRYQSVIWYGLMFQEIIFENELERSNEV